MKIQKEFRPITAYKIAGGLTYLALGGLNLITLVNKITEMSQSSDNNLHEHNPYNYAAPEEICLFMGFSATMGLAGLYFTIDGINDLYG